MAKLKSAKDTIIRGTAIIAGLQVVEQLTGLLSQALIAAYFGATAVTDAYLVAMAVVSLVAVWVSKPITQVIIPMFRYDLSREGEPRAWENVGVLLNNLTIVFLAIVAIGWLAAPWLVRLIGFGFDAETAALSASLTRITLVGVGFIGASLFLSQLWFSYGRFFAPGLGGIVSNLVAAGGLVLLASRWGIYGLAVAVVLGNAANLIVQLPILWRHRRWYGWRIDFRHRGMRELTSLSVPVFVATGGVQIDRIADRFFASMLTAGSLSALAFARLLSQFPDKLLIDPFQKATFPHFTKLIATNEYATYSRQLFQYVRFLFFLSVPAAMGMIVLGDSIVSVAFQRGAFDETAVELTSQALAFYALGLPVAFVGHVFNNTFISLKNTRTTMRMGLLRIGLKIGLSIVLVPVMAHSGLALAESISHFVRTSLLFWLLPAEVKGNEIRGTVRSLGGTLAATTVMGVVILFLKHASDGHLHVILQLACLVPVGAAIYFLASWLSRQSEIEWLGKGVAAITRR